MRPDFKVEYREIQKLQSWWHWIVGCAVPALFFCIGCIQWLCNITIGNHPLPTVWCMAIGSFVLCIVILLFKHLTLQLVITNAGIFYGFNLPDKTLHFTAWDRIVSIKLIKYQFWGYGYHISKRYGLVYNLNGRYGLQITLYSGDKVLIGTQNKNALNTFLKSNVSDAQI
jgi:hypothetical protein